MSLHSRGRFCLVFYTALTQAKFPFFNKVRQVSESGREFESNFIDRLCKKKSYIFILVMCLITFYLRQLISVFNLEDQYKVNF